MRAVASVAIAVFDAVLAGQARDGDSESPIAIWLRDQEKAVRKIRGARE